MARTKAQILAESSTALSKAEARIDNLENALTGLGVYGRDQRNYGKVTWRARMTESEAEEMYAGDGLPRRIVELLPSEATREFIEFEEPDEDVEEKMDELKVQARFNEADVAARLYGGACLFINDGTPRKRLSEPLDLERIKDIRYLVLMTMHELMGGLINIDTDLDSPNYGHPETYQLMDRRGGMPKPMATIHWTRLIRFDGSALPLQAFIRNNYWHDSVLNGCMEATRDFLQSHAGVAAVLGQFRLVSYSVDGLADSIAAGDEQLIMDRLKLVNKARTLLGMTVKDSKEELDVHSDTFAGVKDILGTFKDRMATTTGYPQMVLFQDSPGGMSSTGNSELEGWYNTVAAYQRRCYRPKLDYLLKVIYACKQGPTKGVEPENKRFKFKELWQASAKEVAETEKLEAEGDQIRLDQGALEVSDVIRKRFPAKAATMTDADLAAMDEAVKAEQAAQQEALAAAATATGQDEPAAPAAKDAAPAKKTPPKAK